MKHQMKVVAMFVLTIAVLVLSACGGTAAAAAKIPEITIKAQDYSYEAPKQVAAGLVAVTLENDGKGRTRRSWPA